MKTFADDNFKSYGTLRKYSASRPVCLQEMRVQQSRAALARCSPSAEQTKINKSFYWKKSKVKLKQISGFGREFNIL